MESVTTMRSLELHAGSKVNINGWISSSCGIKESPFGDYFEVSGAVYPLYTRGSKKGKPNYSKADKSTKKTVTFTPEEHNVFVERWETENNICMMCQGKGSYATSWAIGKGAYNFKTCERCNGTGIVNHQPNTASQT